MERKPGLPWMVIRRLPCAHHLPAALGPQRPPQGQSSQRGGTGGQAAQPQVLPHLTAQQRAGPDGQFEHTGENRHAHVGGIAAPVQHQGLQGSTTAMMAAPHTTVRAYRLAAACPAQLSTPRQLAKVARAQSKKPSGNFRPQRLNKRLPRMLAAPKSSSTEVVTAGLWPACTCTQGSM